MRHFILAIAIAVTAVSSTGCVSKIARQAASNAIVGTRALASRVDDDISKQVCAGVELNVKTAVDNAELPMPSFTEAQVLEQPKVYYDKAVTDNEASKASWLDIFKKSEFWLSAAALALMVASKYIPILDPVLKVFMSYRELNAQKQASLAQDGFNKLIDIAESVPKDATVQDYKQAVFKKAPALVNDMINQRLGN